MRKKLFFMLFAIGIVGLFTSEVLYPSGSPGGKTGSPGDGGSNCTSCHNGSPTNVEGWIQSNIPESGYIGGETYTITLTGTQAGAGRFGFEATIEDENNAKSGTVIVTNSIETKLVNSNHAVTHKAAGNTPTGGSKTWSFDWTAPISGTGTVNVYAAFLGSNRGQKAPGNTYLSSLELIENTTGVETVSANHKLNISPSPFKNSFTIHTDVNIKEVRIYNLTASLISTQPVNGISNSITMNTENLKAGLYFISVLADDGKQYTQKAVKSN